MAKLKLVEQPMQGGLVERLQSLATPMPPGHAAKVADALALLGDRYCCAPKSKHPGINERSSLVLDADRAAKLARENAAYRAKKEK